MSKVVFVGNVPYNMGEDQLTDIFRSVGQVVGFRLVFDRETGKPKGYGFCEFADHETAASAVRNLNNVDVGGRPLRIDLADSDPFLEGKTTVRGELVDGGEPGPNERLGRGGGGRRDEMEVFMASLPPGIKVPPGTSPMDTISHTLGTMNPARLTEVLAQMKAFVITHPDHARKVLQTNPQLAYALFQALVLNNIVDPSILQRMREASGMAAPPQPQPAPPPPPPAATYPPPPMPQQYPGYPPAAAMIYPSPQPPNPYYRPPPPPPPNQAQMLAGVSEDQRAVLLQVLNMTPDRINALPEGERAAIQQLRAQFGAA